MQSRRTIPLRVLRIVARAGLLAIAPGLAFAGPLRVAATTPDLGSLIETIGGEQVEVTAFAKGPQDAHFIEPRPSFIRALHRADLFAQTGLDLEIGWAPVLLRSARNPAASPGGSAHLDASVAIRPLDVPQVPVDRSMGDVHPYGNPHYLLDPLNGLRVAALIRERLSKLRPQASEDFQLRYESFARSLVERLVGAPLAERHAPEELARRVEGGAWSELVGPGEASLGGWLGMMGPHRGTRAVEDHRSWVYFARRFGLRLVATLEPKPGIAPTSRHLEQVVETMREQDVPLILTTPYFDPRHARWVASRTGARVVRLAHQPGARDGTDDYLGMIDYNVHRVVEALAERKRNR